MFSWSLLSLSALDLCAGSAITPFLPLIAESSGASTLEIGLINFVYATLQIFCAPFIGKLSDFYGRRIALVIGFIASIITVFALFLITYYDMHYCWIYFAVIPMAICRQTQACIKAVILQTKASNDENQEKHDSNQSSTLNILAQWSLSCYIGTMFGPFLNSFLMTDDKQSSSKNMHKSCVLAMVLFGIALCITFAHPLLSISPKNGSKRVQKRKKKLSFSLFSDFLKLNSYMKKLIIFNFIAYFALNLYRASFVLILKHRLNMDMKSLSQFLSYRGLIGFCMQLYLATKSRSVIKDKRSFFAFLNCDAYDLLFCSTCLLSIAMLGYGFISSAGQLYVLLIIQECGQSMFRTSFQAVFAEGVTFCGLQNQRQTYIGILDSFASIDRSFAPIVFGIIPEEMRYWLTPILAGVIDMLLLLKFSPLKMRKPENDLKSK